MIPEASDAPGWGRVVESGRLRACPPCAIIEALRALVAAGEQRLADALALHLSDVILRRLRRIVGTHHPNRGEDIIERAHGELIEAVMDPTSADGAEIEANFGGRLRFRAWDAIRHERRYHRRFRPYGVDNDGETLIPAGRRLDGGAGRVEVEHLLTRIPDPRKRLAFRLAMDGMQVRAGEPNVAAVLGVDPKTAAKWIAEARAILVAHLEIGA